VIRPIARRIRVATILVLLLSSVVAVAQKSEKPQKKDKDHKEAADSNAPPVIWRDPGDVSALNLLYGAGGVDHAPDPNGTYTFVEEDMNGTSPKFRVKDAQGVEWTVKMGAEPQAETAATRLLWAAGYFTNEDYYSAEIRVEGLPKLKRGEQYISNGAIRRVRLKRKSKGEKDLGNWDWFKNPFLDTREFNGLRVMMSLINNWDLKTINNKIFEVEGEHRYVVSDVGASFGKTGGPMTRSKSDLKGYEKSEFIQREKGDYVDFIMHSRPMILGALNPPNYEKRSHMEKVTQHIPRADARWLGQILSHLTDQQIGDAFRAGGYTAQEVEEYAKVIKERIAALNAL
jgi:hypothetical protein